MYFFSLMKGSVTFFKDQGWVFEIKSKSSMGKMSFLELRKINAEPEHSSFSH